MNNHEVLLSFSLAFDDHGALMATRTADKKEGRTDGRTDRRTDGRTGGQADGRADGWKDELTKANRDWHKNGTMFIH